jgi:hypothetical protein
MDECRVGGGPMSSSNIAPGKNLATLPFNITTSRVCLFGKPGLHFSLTNSSRQRKQNAGSKEPAFSSSSVQHVLFIRARLSGSAAVERC